jgi:putative transcriptional regulator
VDDAPASRHGRLLVAAPSLADSNFHRAVVLMLEHTPDGALGVVLNRPSELPARDALPGALAAALPDDELVHKGGPVQPEAVILLADFVDPGRAAGVAFGSVGIVDPGGEVDELAGAVRSIRAFGGYAGWSGGQLEEEISEEAWIDAPGTADDVFTDDPERLWSRVLDRKGGSWRIIARMPEDPSLN